MAIALGLNIKLNEEAVTSNRFACLNGSKTTLFMNEGVPGSVTLSFRNNRLLGAEGSHWGKGKIRKLPLYNFVFGLCTSSQRLYSRTIIYYNVIKRRKKGIMNAYAEYVSILALV